MSRLSTTRAIRPPGVLSGIGVLLLGLVASLLLQPGGGAVAQEPPAPARSGQAEQARQAGTGARSEPSGTYTNPVTEGTVDTFPDPVTIRGKDGLWYAYGTQNPVFRSKGEQGERIVPILRSADLVDWEYAGELFTPETQPAWHGGSRLWAPDIRYLNGRYTLYYSVPDRNTVGVATAPTPTGPWTDRGAVMKPQSGCPTGNIDQAQFTDRDGRSYLYWGSYDVLCVAGMNADSTRIEGRVTEVAQGRRAEGPYVVRRGPYYYLFYSDAGCCQGAYSGYQVKVGRSTSPTGPFEDDEGVDLMARTSKGGAVVAGSGNRWIGPGHNSVQTDLAGQDWLVYHGIPSDDPDLDPTPEINRKQLSRRPMLIDRLDWIDGWPVVRAGAGASDGRQAAPVTAWDAGGTFNDGSLSGWRRQGPERDGWSTAESRDTGTYVTHEGRGTDPAYLVTRRRTAAAAQRAEADLRVTADTGAAGLTVAYADPDNNVSAWLDRDRNALVTDVLRNGRNDERITPLPSAFRWDSWHNVAVELRGGELTAEVTSDRLYDAVATQHRELPAGAARPGKAGTAARGPGSAADNVGTVKLHTPVTGPVPEPGPGAGLPAYSDAFEGTVVPGTEPDSPWSWVRGPAPGTAMTGGALSWPAGDTGLWLDTNTAPVLTRDAPKGDFTVETRLHFAPERAGQKAGLVLYGNDDRYFSLTRSALPLERRGGALTLNTEFAKEGERPTTTPPTPVFYGETFGGPTADTMWLRLSYHADRADREDEVRASTSRDGEHWVEAGVWSLPVKGPLKMGLVTLDGPGATARFDYVRTYRD
ncbi:family 43 glycosylhydrolase [Streptomyces lycii]|uniref:Family 43 glycosylhydrolase n=1 Tax=Streptomyces lycii TaxID=2654337 RepID=A0ABQ7FDG6_9ACTN|nr:family 43 glycosylhydrolase [Streptomyces lycii]KAF4407094.1 family 43 glycosylhydrolase [Streptomyces lycii]